MALAVGHSIAAVAPGIAGKSKTFSDAANHKASFVPLYFAGEGALPPPSAPSTQMGRREGLSACFAALTLSFAGPSLAAVLEADDDEELLERVKKDRIKRLERQDAISSSPTETGYLQELVYKLSKVGKAIENNDFSEASSMLGQTIRADWIKNINVAFTKLTSSSEEKSEVDAFNSSLATLISSVDKHDIVSSKSAFFTSASALEKWVELAGLVGLLKGL